MLPGCTSLSPLFQRRKAGVRRPHAPFVPAVANPLLSFSFHCREWPLGVYALNFIWEKHCRLQVIVPKIGLLQTLEGCRTV